MPIKLYLIIQDTPNLTMIESIWDSSEGAKGAISLYKLDSDNKKQYRIIERYLNQVRDKS